MSDNHLSAIDLNLLVHLQALLEERNVTRAGGRVHLTQSAMSRSLERLRAVLQDDLLVRSTRGYELTTKGATLLRELEALMPRLEAFWNGRPFTPEMASGEMRVLMTDQAAATFVPTLVTRLREEAPGLRIKVAAWNSDAWNELTGGRVDLILSPIGAPAPLQIEKVYEERFVCVVSKDNSFKGRRFSLSTYLEQQHIAIETDRLGQTLIERPLAERGIRREVAVTMPYFMAAVLAVERSNLVLSCPFRFAQDLPRRYKVRQIVAPVEIATFPYSLIWHPRHQADHLHVWFRETVRQVMRATTGGANRKELNNRPKPRA